MGRYQDRRKKRVMVLEQRMRFIRSISYRKVYDAGRITSRSIHRRQYRKMPSGRKCDGYSARRSGGSCRTIGSRIQQSCRLIREHNVPGAFNLWRGFGVKPSETASCDCYIEHMRK